MLLCQYNGFNDWRDKLVKLQIILISLPLKIKLMLKRICAKYVQILSNKDKQKSIVPEH